MMTISYAISLQETHVKTHYCCCFTTISTAEASQQTSASDSPDPLHYRDVFLLSLLGFIEGKPGIITGLRQAGVPVTVLDIQATSTASKLVTSVATMQDDCVIAADSRYVNGLERKIVAWIQPAEHDSLMVHFDRLMALSRTSGQLITITTPRGPEQATVQNPRFLLEEIKSCASYEEMEEKALQFARDHITEEMTREINSVLQIYVLQNMGGEEVEHPIFFDLRQGYGVVERGEWTGTTRCAAVITVHLEDFLSGPDVKKVMELFAQGRIKWAINDSMTMFRFHEFAKKALGL
ncbi:hypothetical protein V1264_017347 [Littorina saxatilis]|uniref:Uncharacterized protein n=1 Tax=Littorina saxatilis TaxID=31220 RepID=A0AAN9BJF5_9CAEN